jgi:hypothetical protein
MIRRCEDSDSEVIWTIINDGAQAYKGVIPADQWTEPYMSREKMQHEISDGVVFWGFEEGGELVGVMGIQKVQDVTLHSTRLCEDQVAESRDWSAVAESSAGIDEGSHPDWNMGGCGLGDTLL